MITNTIKKALYSLIVLTSSVFIFVACGSDDEEQYIAVPVSPVVLDLDAAIFPYEKLSEYNFFQGEMKDLDPVYKVIPYDLNSSLFTDYAKKKRFIYMPPGVQATYSADGKVLEFPQGTVLIKNFYYDNMVGGDANRIIETRLMIRKNNDWVFATYVWNNEQTEAILDNDGSYAHLTWNENGVEMNTNYRIPSVVECTACHKIGEVKSAIGVKPQNLNKMFAYPEGTKNQLAKLVEEGYLSSANLPSQIVSTVDWADTSKPLELRVRSYLDINCAHCHSEGTSCDYTPMRLGFAESTTAASLGVCIEPVEFVTGNQQYIVAGQNATRSLMHFRMSTNIQSEMMPLVGRTVVHTEGLELVEQWITAMESPCP